MPGTEIMPYNAPMVEGVDAYIRGGFTGTGAGMPEGQIKVMPSIGASPIGKSETGSQHSTWYDKTLNVIDRVGMWWLAINSGAQPIATNEYARAARGQTTGDVSTTNYPPPADSTTTFEQVAKSGDKKDMMNMILLFAAVGVVVLIAVKGH